MGLQMPTNDVCAFCAYLNGTRPFTVLWSDQKVAVLVTREQRGIDHLLVLPRHHYATVLDVPDSDAEELMIAIRDAAQTISRTSDPKGVAVWQNNGVPAHQAIAHLHFHVAGTFPGGGTELGEVPELSLAATDTIASGLLPHVPPRVDRNLA